ncbi:major facilitator superfamily domain-containing protein [Colletotrichum lupini]|nr:major facilitator superfamily domain-containing protein [Colletotrichum lupini]
MKDRALLSAQEEKKLLRRVDFRLMILCAIIFMIKNVDSNNVANARIMNKGTPRNIMTQLKMTADDYNWVSTIYNVTWGIVLACHAAVTSSAGLLTARFFLGLAESGMFPGIILQMSYWYRADEMTPRLLIFCAGMNGRHGLSGWQWFFLVEGVITIGFGILLLFIFPDFPAQAKWLSDKEKRFLQARLPPNAPRSSESNFKASEIWDTMKDQRLWWFAFIWATKTIGSTGLSFYLPTIVASLGLASIAESQLLTIPSSVLAIILIAISGYLTNSLAVPYPLVALVYLVSNLACYGVMVAYPNNGGVYAATLIAAGVSLAWFATMWPWRLQTTFRATGSAFAIAWVNALGGIGTIVGPQIFRSKYAPEYTVSFAVAMGMTGACILAICWTWWITRETERQTRHLRKRRLAAHKTNEVILDDVDIDADFKTPKVHT